jgi:hypothetical protein
MGFGAVLLAHLAISTCNVEITKDHMRKPKSRAEIG